MWVESLFQGTEEPEDGVDFKSVQEHAKNTAKVLLALGRCCAAGTHREKSFNCEFL